MAVPASVAGALLVAIALAFIGYALLASAPQHLRTITVTASGSVSSVPNQAQLTLSLNATGATAAAAVSNLGTIAGSLNATLLPLLNGNASNMQTQSYSVFVPPRCSNSTLYYPAQSGCIPQGQPMYYVAEESLMVTLPNAGNATAAITGATSINGVGISGISAKLSAQQQSGMMQQALQLALSNATSQATALANGEQVEVVNMTVQNGYIIYPLSTVSAAQAASNQSFFSGRATVTKSVYVIFAQH